MACLTVTSSEGKNAIIELFIENKFNTTDTMEEIHLAPVEEENLGVPDVVFLFQTAHEMMLHFTKGELSQAIGLLSTGKAEGLDRVTKDMLMNTGTTAREMLLDLFNNVLTGGSLPKDWKIGNIVLIPKKPSCSDLNNYQPIMLISCMSKLLTKMLTR